MSFNTLETQIFTCGCVLYFSRHVLKFMMSGPLGYHVHLCSSTQFVFGDEETVMAQLTKVESEFPNL